MIRSNYPFEEYYAVASRNGLTKPKKIRGEGIKFLNMGELFANRRIRELVMERVPVTEKEKHSSLLESGDLLFARQSIVPSGAGKCSIFLGDKGPVTFDSHLIRVRLDKSVCDPLFVFYYFESNIGRSDIETIIDYGAGISGIKGSDLRNLPVTFPSLREQRKIAVILGALDDKIELNRKMAATLEAMSRALYRSWFVDFDPVHARCQGAKPAHMDEATAALFPDRFGDDGLPQGWGMQRLGEFLTLNYGKALKKNLRQPGMFPVYGSGGTNSTHEKPLVAHPTIVVGRKGTVGSVHWAPTGCWPIDTTYYVTTESPLVYALHVLQHLPLSDMNTDAAVPGLNRENAYRLEVPFPGPQVIEAFADISDAMQKKIDNNEVENQTLATLRDNLLSRLMSGELRISEAREMAVNRPGYSGDRFV